MNPLRRLWVLFFAVMIFFSMARVVLFLTYRDLFSDLNVSSIVWAFASGLRFDAASTVVCLAPTLLVLLIPWRRALPRFVLGGAAIYAAAAIAGLALVLAGDIIYYAHVKRHLSNEISFILFDGRYLVESAMKEYALPTVGVLAGIAAVAWLLWRVLVGNVRRIGHHGVKSFLTLAALVILGRGGWGLKPLAIIDAYDTGQTNFGNLTLNGVFTSSQTLFMGSSFPHRFLSDEDALAEVLAAMAGQGVAAETPPLPPGTAAVLPPTAQGASPLERFADGQQPNFRVMVSDDAARRPPNLVVIMVESLSRKYVDSFAAPSGDAKRYGVTPILDRLAEESIRFSRFYAHGQRSVEGLQSIMTSVPSLVGMPTVGTGLASSYSKLATMARDNGYDDVFVSSMPRRSFRVDSIAGSVGFRKYYGQEDMPMLLDYPDKDPQVTGWDYETLMFLHGRLREAREPFIGYVFPSTDHTPYPRLPERFTKYPHHPTAESGYLNALHYTDWSIGEFLAACRREPWFANTIFVITGDHVIAHYQSDDFLEKFHVPLLLYAPELLKPRVLDVVGSQLDLLPTFVSLLGWRGWYTSLGTNLLAKQDSFAFVRQGSVIGAITERGFVKHSLRHRLESHLFDGSTDDEYVRRLERRLLALDQVSYALMHANRWVTK